MSVSAGPTGLMIAAPASGSGKTVLMLGLLRALKNQGVSVSAAKAGPDYIDPAFHALACGVESVNLDPWAMQERRLLQLARDQPGDFLLVEAMMGLFDGAADGSGSAADLAAALGTPIVLVVDAARQSHSIAALVEGFARHRKGIEIAGVVLNRVGSVRHETMLREALEPIAMPVLGVVHRSDELHLPERHLGLVQAGELDQKEAFLERAGALIAEQANLDALQSSSGLLRAPQGDAVALPPLGSRIAIARDAAFSFLYPHWLADWCKAGTEISFFSPLADECPSRDADAIFLPGGYPELHAAQLASAGRFRSAMQKAAARGITIYGECGGYMVLGDGIEDSTGARHAMCGLLRLETSFVKRRLHLGYRKVDVLAAFPLGTRVMGHEFHYTSALKEEGEPLFSAWDARGEDLGNCGLRSGSVLGSYLHLIDGVGE